MPEKIIRIKSQFKQQEKGKGKSFFSIWLISTERLTAHWKCAWKAQGTSSLGSHIKEEKNPEGWKAQLIPKVFSYSLVRIKLPLLPSKRKAHYSDSEITQSTSFVWKSDWWLPWIIHSSSCYEQKATSASVQLDASSTQPFDLNFDIIYEHKPLSTAGFYWSPIG